MSDMRDIPYLGDPFVERRTKGNFFIKKIIDNQEVYFLDQQLVVKHKFHNSIQDAAAYVEKAEHEGKDDWIEWRSNVPLTVEHVVEDRVKLVALPSGVYNYSILNDQYCFIKTDLRKDNLGFIPKISKDILDRVNNYLSKKSIYEEKGGSFRTSYLLYGPPGTGKTTLLRNLITEYDNGDNIIIFTQQPIYQSHTKILNQDPRLKFVIVEELTHVLDNPRILRHFLDFLDGENSLTNAVTFATTNYPEKLPENLVNRRGRFDRFYKIDKMEPEENKIFAESFLKRDITEEEHKIVNKMNISEIKDLCMSHLIENLSFKDYLKELEKHKNNYKNFFEEYKQAGMGIGARDDDY